MVQMDSEFHLTIKMNEIMSFARKWLQSEVSLLKPEKKYISLSCLNTHMHTHTQAHIHTHGYIYTRAHTGIYTHTEAHIHTQVHV